jgi:hypothetical protein
LANPTSGTEEENRNQKRLRHCLAYLLTAAAAIVIPIVVAMISGNVQNVVTIQSTGKDYMQIALGILEISKRKT